MHDQQRLEKLVAAHHPCVAIDTHEEVYALDLIRDTALRLHRPLLIWSATRGVYEGLLEDSTGRTDTEHPAAGLYHFGHQIENAALCVAIDLVGHLGDERTLRALRDVIHRFRDTERCLVLLDHRAGLPEVITAGVTTLELSLPGEKDLEQIIRRTLRRLHRESPVHAKLKRKDLDTIIRNLRGLNRTQAEQIITDCVTEDRTLDATDINKVLAYKRKRLHQDGVLEYVEAPVDLSTIGGLANLKRWLKQRENIFSEQAAEFGLESPRGVLMLGVQGAGKSLCAKAIATAWQRPLLRLDPGVLYDRYVGESERRLRSALRQAELMAPIILWIDEIEKGFASAASQSTDGGLSQRMFGTLLTWMQEHEAPVFLIATANNIDALPPELLRKGRFDEIFFVDLPTPPVRREIFAIHLRKRNRNPDDFDLEALAEGSPGYSGAEIEQAIIAALHAAFADSTEIDTPRILAAVAGSPPLSVTMAERIEHLRSWARSRCVPAD